MDGATGLAAEEATASGVAVATAMAATAAGVVVDNLVASQTGAEFPEGAARPGPDASKGGTPCRSNSAANLSNAVSARVCSTPSPLSPPPLSLSLSLPFPLPLPTPTPTPTPAPAPFPFACPMVLTGPPLSLNRGGVGITLRYSRSCIEDRNSAAALSACCNSACARSIVAVEEVATATSDTAASAMPRVSAITADAVRSCAPAVRRNSDVVADEVGTDVGAAAALTANVLRAVGVAAPVVGATTGGRGGSTIGMYTPGERHVRGGGRRDLGVRGTGARRSLRSHTGTSADVDADAAWSRRRSRCWVCACRDMAAEEGEEEEEENARTGPRLVERTRRRRRLGGGDEDSASGHSAPRAPLLNGGALGDDDARPPSTRTTWRGCS